MHAVLSDTITGPVYWSLYNLSAKQRKCTNLCTDCL